MSEPPTVTSQEDQHVKAISDGLLSVLLPVAQLLDERSTAVRETQGLLANEIDRLTEELDKFLANSRLPGEYEEKLGKLATMRRRITVVNTTMLTIQSRVDKMVAAIDKENRRHKRLQQGKSTSFFM